MATRTLQSYSYLQLHAVSIFAHLFQASASEYQKCSQKKVKPSHGEMGGIQRDFMEHALIIMPHIPEEKTQVFRCVFIECSVYKNYPGQPPVLYTPRHHCSRCHTLKPISETVALLNVAYLGRCRDNWGKKTLWCQCSNLPCLLNTAWQALASPPAILNYVPK